MTSHTLTMDLLAMDKLLSDSKDAVPKPIATQWRKIMAQLVAEQEERRVNETEKR